MQSESRTNAVPTAADTWTTIGSAYTVPAGVARISKVIVSISPEHSTTAASKEIAPVYRLTGSGLLEQSPHQYVGAFGGYATVTTGGISHEQQYMMYDVDIPVQTGGTILPEVNTLQEALAAGSVKMVLVYDNKPPTMNNSQSDYVKAVGATSTNAWTTTGTFTVPRMAEGKNPTRIRSVIVAVGIDQGTTAINLRLDDRHRLSGSGINEGGQHEYIGTGGFTGELGTTPSQGIMQSKNVLKFDVDIPVNPGGQILAEHIFDTKAPTASLVTVGLLYGT